MANGDRYPGSHIALPGPEAGPLRKIARRLAIALALITLVAGVTYAERDGYIDPEDDEVSLLDAFYYSTVSITTTGYGDIRPVTDSARFVTTVIVTPARVLFLILLVGTTLEILAERSRQAFRLLRWRRGLRNHTIICGYGTKGQSAVRTLLGKRVDAQDIVVIDERPEARARASEDGLATIAGSAAQEQILRDAGCAEARSIIVAVDRDDTAVLVTLTARELNERATIVGAVREEENAHLLHQSGADGVITSSGAAGRLLGLSSETPQVVEVLEDLLTVGEGLDVSEREIEAHEAGNETEKPLDCVTLAVVRDGELLRFDDPRIGTLRAGDRVVELRGLPRGAKSSQRA